jgi:hypothetical protein
MNRGDSGWAKGESNDRITVLKKDSPMDAKMGEGWERANATWTRWSKCLNSSENANNEMRHRYLKCKEAKDVRKCPKESIPCKRSNRLIIRLYWDIPNLKCHH